MPAPKKIDWSAPNKLVKSCIVNKLVPTPYGKNRHPIGHMLIGLKDGSRHDIVGMTTDENRSLFKKTILDGHGLGILFESIKGKLESKEINEPQIQERIQKGDIAFIKYKITQAVFDRLWNYLQEYKKKGYDKLYNGCNTPREGGGAGCSAFAISFLEVAGLENILPKNQWKIEVNVPTICIGGPEGNNKRVSVFRLLKTKHWEKEQSPTYKKIELFEPTLFYEWIVSYSNKNSYNFGISTITEGKAKGIIIDCTHLVAPNEPIWVSNE